VRHTQMVLRGREFGIDGEGLFEVPDGFVAAVEHGQKKADLVLNARRVRIDRGGLLPGRERAGSIAAGRCCTSARFYIAERRLGAEGYSEQYA
jgi:hypothetical protein